MSVARNTRLVVGGFVTLQDETRRICAQKGRPVNQSMGVGMGMVTVCHGLGDGATAGCSLRCK